MHILQFRCTYAYDSVLLVDADTQTVLGAWGATSELWEEYLRDRDNINSVSLWPSNSPARTDPGYYGDLMSESEY